MKRARALLLAFALLSAAVLASLPARAETLYFAVVNTTVYPFGKKYQPWPPSGRGTMVPHVVLTGEGFQYSNRLGLRSQWSPEERYFTLYNDDIQLTFVYGQNTAFSGEKRYTAPIYEEYGFFFIPADLVCEVFGFIMETPSETAWGTMVRIRNGGLDNEQFVKTYGNAFIKPEYDAYMASLPSPSPSSPLIPGPSPSPSPSPKEVFAVQVYLTFDGPVNGATTRLLDLLEGEGLPALFFLPPDSLAGDPSAVRRMTARHQVGLLLDEPEGEGLADAARFGNELLRQTAFIKTLLLRADNAPSEASGYRYWGYTHRFKPTDGAKEIVAAVTPLLAKTAEPTTLVLSFGHSDEVTGALTELLPLIGKENIWRVNPGESPVL